MIVIPIVEIAVFIQVGGVIGLWPTLITVVLTAMAGTALLRHQGLATLWRAQQSLEAGRFPVAEVFDGLCLLVAGALLLTPGFVTDAAGLLLFVPALRRALRQAVGRYLVASGRVRMAGGGPAPPGGGPGGTVIDGTFEEVPPGGGPGERPSGGDGGEGPPPGALPP